MAKNTAEKLDIQEAIKLFANDDITNAGINLFSVLGYNTSLQAPLDKKTYTEFKENYIDSSPSADRFSEEKALVSDWKSIDILFQLTNDSFNGTKSLFEKSINPTDIQSYLCFAIELKKNEYSKTQIAGITREINKLFSIPIIIIFKYAKLLTLSVINRRVNKRDNERDVLEKVTLIKDIFFEKPHRAHIEILFDMSFAQLNAEYTIYNFETLHKAWSQVLDTQTLNKRFYTELSNWFFWAIKTVVYPGYEMEAARGTLFTKEDKLREHNAKNLIRLLTRLLFVWFIKEKELIPEELFDEKVINNLITSFEPDKYYSSDAIDKENKSIYYKAILQNLFFASLNAERGKRAFRLDGQNQNATSLMRYQRFHNNPDNFVELIESKVPFMNGGLFECLDHQDDEKKGKKGGAIINYEDGFSDRKDNELFVPDYVFFGKDVKVDLSTEYDDKKKKDVTVNGIINILQKYKFTIAENTPVEEDIALDPELLGRVFENLLASYNPETKTNARKQTGSFYTPRPIVEYMVDESLKAYLKTKIKDSALSKGTLEEKTKAVEELENTLDSKLNNLIAYNETEPEFTSEECFQILRYIDKCKILDPACGSGAFPMGILQKIVYVIHKLDPQNDNWKQIQIQKISNDTMLTPKEKNELQKELLTVFDDNELDYARKLYLIENCIHGIDIQPIATQISRLRFFISLIVDQKVDSTKPNFGVRPLPNLENRFVTANSLIGLDEQQAYLSSKEIDELMLTLQKVRHDLFKAKTPKHKFELRQKDKRIRVELEQELLKLGFEKENAKLISTWDPYDKNRSAEFFDAEWMFGIKDGFDVVIGNPPYIKIQNIDEQQADYFKSHYETATGKFDMYVPFVESAFRLINQAGTITFIHPHRFLNVGYGKGLRTFIKKRKGLNKFLYFGADQVFDSATTYSGIFIYRNNSKIIYHTNITNINLSLLDFEKTEWYELGETWSFEKGESSSILEKINNSPIKLLDLFEGIYQGLISIGDDIFMLEGTIKDNLFHGYSKQIEKEVTLEAELMKPVLKGENIRRYLPCKNTLYVIYAYKLNEYGKTIPLEENALKKNYPRIYSYLMQFKETLVEKKIKYKTNPKYWYGLHRPREISVFSSNKIITPQLQNYSNFTIDDGTYYPDAGGYMLKLKKYNEVDFYYCLGILNSSLFYHFIKTTSTVFNNDYYYFKSAYIEPFHFPQVSEDNKKYISNIAKTIIDMHKKDNSDTYELETKINRKVFEIYGLTEEEIKIVEGK